MGYDSACVNGRQKFRCFAGIRKKQNFCCFPKYSGFSFFFAFSRKTAEFFFCRSHIDHRSGVGVLMAKLSETLLLAELISTDRNFMNTTIMLCLVHTFMPVASEKCVVFNV